MVFSNLVFCWQWFRFFTDYGDKGLGDSGLGQPISSSIFLLTCATVRCWSSWSADVIMGRVPLIMTLLMAQVMTPSLVLCFVYLCKWKGSASSGKRCAGKCEGCMQWAGALPSTLAGRSSVPALPLPVSVSTQPASSPSGLCSNVTWGSCGHSELQVPCPPFSVYPPGILRILHAYFILSSPVERKLLKGMRFVFLHRCFVQKLCLTHSRCLVFG